MSALCMGILAGMAFGGFEVRGGMMEVDRYIIGGFYLFMCLFCLSRVLRPGWYERTARRKLDVSKGVGDIRGARVIGHHPDCERFRNHLTHIGKTPRCAGCIGLVVGGMVSLGVATVYMYDHGLLPIGGQLAALGLVLVLFSTIEVIWKDRNMHIHALASSLLPVGSLLLVITSAHATNSWEAGCIAVVISMQFVDSRIHLSHQNHKRICRECPEGCERF